MVSTPARALAAGAQPAGERLRQEVRLAVARAAAVWRDCGVERGEPVAVHLADGVESVVACLGAQAAGGVPVVIDPATPAHEWVRLWSQARWRFILVESRGEHPAAMRDFLMTRDEWRHALATIGPIAIGSATIET